MDQLEQGRRLIVELCAVIDRYRKEYDITYLTLLGVMHIITATLTKEALSPKSDDDETES